MSCFNCQERHVGCHLTCERYAAWLKEKKEAKSNETATKSNETASIAEESAMINYIQRSKDRYKRRAGRK